MMARENGLAEWEVGWGVNLAWCRGACEEKWRGLQWVIMDETEAGAVQCVFFLKTNGIWENDVLIMLWAA